MPKHKGKKPSASDSTGVLVTKDSCGDSGDHVTYGLVIRMLGGHNVLVRCSETNREHLCVIRGKMRNKRSCMIAVDDIVLVALRAFDNKATGDIVLKYSSDDVRRLKVIDPEILSLQPSNNKGITSTTVTCDVEFETCDFEDI